MTASLSAIFDRGHTYYDGNAIDVSSSYANVGGIHLEGEQHEFPDWDPATPGVGTPNLGRLKRSGRKCRCILVRNVSGQALLPGQVVTWKAGYQFRRVDGYINSIAVRPAGIVDELLPSTGVPDGDLFWLLVNGPSLVNRAISNFGADLAAGDMIYALTTSSTTGATTAGRFNRFAGTFTATQTTDGTLAQILDTSKIGWALSASATDAGTSPKVLCNVDLPF